MRYKTIHPDKETPMRYTVLSLITASVLAGCATPSNGPQIVHKIEYVGVPQHLLIDCPRIDLGLLRTNGDMAQAVLTQDKSLRDCNDDKAAIRALSPQK